MRNLAIAVSLFGIGCASPAYRAPEVTVPVSYDVRTAAPASASAGVSQLQAPLYRVESLTHALADTHCGSEVKYRRHAMQCLTYRVGMTNVRMTPEG